MGNEILGMAKRRQTQTVADRRYLHRNAELGFELPLTKEYVWRRLQSMGYQPKECGRCGITAEIGGGKECFLLRADMDGLPIAERSGEPFAARNGHMHACGHDLHTAMLLAAAGILRERERELRQKVRLLFQPAEELLEGARDCIEGGAIDGVSGAMMLHVLPSMPFSAGTAIVSEAGVTASAADFFDVTFYGKGCHGSSPWQGADSLLMGAQAVTALQSISARELSPDVPAVLTFGKFFAGDADNAIAGKSILSGTLRAMNEERRTFIKKRMEEIVKATARGMRGRARVSYKGGCPCLQNDGAVSLRVYEAAKRTLGEKFVLRSSQLPKGGVGGSEDFAYIAKEIPSVMVGICAGSGGQVQDETKRKSKNEPLHSPHVCFDERCMPYGAALLSASVLKS